jgi:large subunit ribosomal protein L25
MSIDAVLTAQVRQETGKGAMNRMRRSGRLPAVVYGRGKPAVLLSFEYRHVLKTMFSGEYIPSLVKLKIEGQEGAKEQIVTLKEHQVDPIKRSLLHLDFALVDMDKPITLEVPVALEGEPAGVERGGMLEQIRHEVTVNALPHLIPESISVDVSELDINDAVHVEDLRVGEGVELIYDVNFTIATVSAPVTEEDLEAEEGEEGEEGLEAGEGEEAEAEEGEEASE